MFNLNTIIKAFIIGATMMVPGVSGGSMAMVLGIYNQLISAVSSFFRDVKRNIIFLSMFSLFALLGIFLCAKQILNIINLYPNVCMCFFIGLVFGSVPMLYKKSKIDKINYKDIIYFVLGLIIVYSFQLIPKVESSLITTVDFKFIISQFITGFIVAIGFILPGISFSYLLLVLGTYDFIIYSISSMNIFVLLPFALGFVFGVIFLTKFLEVSMSRFPRITYVLILGFLLGSVIPILPEFKFNLTLIVQIISFVIGFMIIFYVSRKEESINEKK